MKNLMYCMFLFAFVQANAQTPGNAAVLQSQLKADLGFQGLGLSYEPVFGKKFTTVFSAGFGGGYDIAEGSLNYEAFQTALYFSVNPKYFYNLDKRASQGKSTSRNSGNYFGLRLACTIPAGSYTDLIRNSFLGNLHWGMERAFGKRFSWNGWIGAGYALDMDWTFGTIYPALGFKLSYMIH